MSELPSSWVMFTLGDDCISVKGKKPKVLLSDSDSDLVPYVDIKAFEKGILSNYADPEDGVFADVTDTLMVWDGARSGLVGNGVEGIIGSTLVRVRPKCSDKRYLHYFLKSQFGYINSNTKGTGIPHVDPVKLWSIPYPLAPLNEQKRIADKLDSILAKVDRAQARLDKIPGILKRFRQSVLAAATSGELTKEWREENIHHVCDFNTLTKLVHTSWLEAREAEFKRKGKFPSTNSWLNKKPIPNFGESIAPSWTSVELGVIAEVIDPNPSHRMPHYVDEGKPFISSENIVDITSINFNKGKKITEEEVNKQKERYKIVEGAFAFTRIGSIGKSVLLPTPHDYGISHAMAVVIPYKSVVDSRFLMFTMNCETILKQALHGVQSVGVPDLGIGKMKSFQIPLPSLKEQQEIVNKVRDLLALTAIVENQFSLAKSKINRLTESVLAKAFCGELVPQDANDEPASELLNRIKSSEIEGKPKRKATSKPKASATLKSKRPKQAITELSELLDESFSSDLAVEKHEVIDSLRVSHQTEIKKAQELLVDAKFSVEQFRSITGFKGGYDELKALIMNLLKGIPSVSEPLLAIESWDEKSGDYLMRLVNHK